MVLLGRNMHYVQAETLSTNGTEETGGFLGAVGSACMKKVCG